MTFALYPTVADEVVRYLEDGTLNETLGLGPTLTLSAGTERWTDILPGVSALAFDEATKLLSSVYYAPLAISGALTVECIVRLFELPLTTDYWWFFGHSVASSEVESANAHFTLGMWDVSETGTAVNERKAAPTFWHERGAGLESALAARSWSFEVGGLYHVAATRAAADGGTQATKLYVNGALVSSASLLAHTGGTSLSARLSVGADIDGASGGAASRASCAVGFIRVCSRALSDAEIEAAYDATLGGVFGARLSP